MGLDKTAHEEALSWFSEHAGQRMKWPSPVNDIYLANKAKGIHKPAGLRYALSVRQTLNSNYENSTRFLGDGTWEIRYAQEAQNPELFTNRGLAACLCDEVPIGVLQQVTDGSSLNYQVLGLGRVVDFSDGWFTIKQLILQDFDGPLLLIPTTDFVVQADLDARTKIIREINTRRGQPEFRNELLRAYAGRCAVTGNSVVPTLEAAHILPYRGVHTNHVQNGILMRSDIHTLFDVGIISINPIDFRIEVGVKAQSNEYSIYHGRTLSLPELKNEWPSKQALRLHLAKMPLLSD